MSLSRALLVDAVASGAMGLLLVVGGTALGPLLGISAPFLRGAGFFLVPFAAVVAWTGSKPAAPSRVVWAIVAVNAAWVIGSAAMLGSASSQPTLLGRAFVGAQAAVVLVLTLAQASGLKNATRAPAHER